MADGQKRQDGTRGRPPATSDGAPAAPHAGPSHRVPGELLILAGLILVMATAVYVWRRPTRPGDYLPLQEARRSPWPTSSPTPVRGA